MAKVVINIIIVLLVLILFSFLGAVSFPGLPAINSSLDTFVRAFLLLLIPGIIMGIMGHFLGKGIRGIKNSFEALGLTYVSAFLLGAILALLSLLNFAYSVHVNFNWIGTTWYAQVFTIFIIGASMMLAFLV
ncbi:MAG TPA: hypothetical protein DIU08_00670 [Ktedonobacter sp.]|jgi:hypothetical protein|nr:hypothetical protein [Ktedonobacter sp.]